jgi:AbrB family looped-hinge helix DNA binding protein
MRRVDSLEPLPFVYYPLYYLRKYYREAIMHITQKGQVTIPADVRAKLGLLPHTEVEFAIQGNTAILRKKGSAARRGTAIVAGLKGRGDKKMSTDEIMALTRSDD